MGQAMLDCRTKVDQRKDHQDLMRLRTEFHTQREKLIQERREWKVLEEFKVQYELAMGVLRAEK